MFALLGLPTSLLLFAALLLLMVRPDLESITLPELSTIRVLDPDVAVLPTDELLVVPEFLLYALEDLPFAALDLLPTLLLDTPLVRPALAMLERPLDDL